MATTKKKANVTGKKSSSPSSTGKSKKWSWSPGSIVLSTSVGTGGNLREQNIDLVQTLVHGVYIGFCTKSWSSNEASYLFPMEKSLNDKDAGTVLAKDWKYVFGFLPRRDISIDDGTTTMKAKRGSKWDWKAVIIVKNDEDSVDKVGRHIASCFSKFTRNKEVMDSPEKYNYRQCYSNDPKPLNYYLLDLDVAKILHSLVYESGEYASKEEMFLDEEVMTAFYGSPEFGKEYLEDLTDEDWDNLLGDGQSN
eukprot:scaffold33607_cov84-Skeletonema_dohrnii-CCMP3373.AAC.3